MKTNFARIASFLMVLVLAVATLVPSALATTVTVLDGAVSITDSLSNITASGNSVTAKAAGGLFSQKTNTLTIYNDSGATGKLTFDYSASNYSSFSMGQASGSHSVTLEAGGSCTLSITGKKAISSNTATLTLSNIALSAVSASSQVTYAFDSAYGSVTVNGAAISSGDVLEASMDTGAALVAAPASGATFLGWTDGSGKVLSTAASYTLNPTEDMTVKAFFIGANSVPHFAVGGTSSHTFKYGLLSMSSATYYTVSTTTYLFDDLNAAAQAAAAGTSKNLVLLNSATLPAGNYTIPSGVTLLIPFDSANTMYVSQPDCIRVDSDSNDNGYTTPTAYRTLTMADGANITVNGAISLSAKHAAARGSQTNGGGAPSGSVSFIRMQGNSNITVANGGVFYAWGFVTGSGSVTAQNGASIYENFQVQDFRGGTQSTGMENGVFPISQYYVQNIEVPMTIEYGAKEYSYATMWMQSSYMSSSVNFFGASDAMFNLTSGNVVKKYDGAADRLVITLNGNMNVSPLSLKMGTSTLDSDEYELPINSNITVFAESGVIEIKQDVAMLPGSEIIVGANASGSLGTGVSIYVYDADQWGTFAFKAGGNTSFTPVMYAPGRTYTRTAADLVDARIEVAGTLDASLGYAYTTAGGANICGVEGGTVTMTPGTQTVTYQLVQNTGYTEIPLTNAKFRNADGTYRNSGTQNFTYTYTNGSWFANCEHTSRTSEVTTAATCSTTGVMTYTCVCGDVSTEVIPTTAHTEVVDAAVAATCTATGLTEGKHCSVCNTVIVAQETVAKLAHTEVIDAAVAATCTETGLTEGKHCSVCSTVLVAQEEVAALGHTEVIDAAVAATCTESGLTEGKHCSVCSTVLVAQETVAALGHTEVIDAAVAATCTETGLTEGKHCSVCSTVLVAQETVAALGHTEVIDAAVAATCTETGLTEGKHCSVCSTVLVAQEVTPVIAHSFGENGSCSCGLVGIAAVTAEGTSYYATVEEAAAAGAYVSLIADLTADITLTADCYLDLNGKTLTGDITLEGDAILYLFDTATADYTAANRGKLVGKISGNVCRSFNTPAVYGHNYKYLVLQETDGSWTAHRYYLAVKSVVLTPANATGTAVDYKTVFKCNEVVAQYVTAYGAKITGDATAYADAVAAGLELTAGSNTAVTTLANTLSLENSDETNAANLLAAPTVNAYIVIGGQELTSVGVTQSLEDILVAVNERTDLTKMEKTALAWMYDKFKTVIDALEADLSVIKSYIW